MNIFRSLAALSLLSLLLPSSAEAVDDDVLEAQKQRIAVVNKVAPSVVAIFGAGGGGGGSGVLISPDGYALTNFHVTNGAGNFMKCGLNDGVLYDGVIVGIDPTGDVALVKLLGRDDFPHSKMGDSDQVQVGDWTYAMGNPFLLATDFRPTVTYGIVSGTHRYQYPAGTFLEYTDCIQIDTSINPGNSGGPLFNEQGEVIGINGRGSFEKRGRVNSGAGYAISINQIKHFMGHLKSGRIVDHATLGATVYTDTEGTVRIDYVAESSEAFRRGLQPDDELVSFAGRPIRSVNQFKNVLGIFPKGWTLPLTYRRDGEKYTINARLEPLHNASEMLMGQKPPQPKAKPEPKPGEKPKEGEPDRKPKPNPLQMLKKPQAPKEFAHMFVKKPGYANYYFNELNQKRLLESLAELGTFGETETTWKLSGTTAAGKPYELGLAPSVLALRIEETLYSQLLEGVDIEDVPEKTGGLLIGLHHWKLLLAGGKTPFSEFFYLGTEPLDGTERLVDVLSTELTGIKTLFFFDAGTGALVGFDTQLLDDVDPCEVRVVETQKLDDRTWPKVLKVHHAGRDRFTLKIDAVDLITPGEKSTVSAE